MSQIQEPVHPLFLPEEDDDAPQVSEIQVSRMENGQQVFAPRVRPASELQSLEQIAGEFGGGTYILIARYDGRISTRRKIVLPGPPKPMYDEGPKPPETKSAPSPVIDPMLMMMGGAQGGGGLMPILMMMFQQQNAAADRQTQMFIAMMQGTRESSAEEKAAAREELRASVERERINSERQMAMFKEMMMSRGSGSGEEFTRGVEFMRSFATQQIEVLKAQTKGEDTDWGSLLETLGQAMQGLNLFKQVTGGAAIPEAATQVAAEAAQ